MVDRNPDIWKAVRSQVLQAEEKLQIACRLLRENGFPESADDLARTLKMARVWTNKDGIIDCMENPKLAYDEDDD